MAADYPTSEARSRLKDIASAAYLAAKIVLYLALALAPIDVVVVAYQRF